LVGGVTLLGLVAVVFAIPAMIIQYHSWNSEFTPPTGAVVTSTVT